MARRAEVFAKTYTWNDVARFNEFLKARGHLGSIDHDTITADFKAFHSKIGATFSNMRLTVEETIEEGGKVAARWTVRLTHSGQHWAGIAAKNKDAVVSGISIARIRNGRIVAGWDNWDAETGVRGMCIWCNSLRNKFRWKRLPYATYGAWRRNGAPRR